MSKFSLLSLNTFGLPFFLGLGRMRRLAQELAHHPADVICLQELQQNAYVPILQSGLKLYPYQAVFPNPLAPKGGLGTYSNLPLTWQSFEVYQDRGLMWMVSFADWALYKGMLVTHLVIDGQEIVVINTHLHANYTGDWSPKNPLAGVEQRQVQQLTHLVNELPAQALVVVCGDFNFPRDCFIYEELIARSGMSDPLAETSRATYRPFPLVPATWKISLDYVLLRLPSGNNFQVHADVLEIEDSTRGSTWGRFLTDHNALTVNINWGNDGHSE